jgi:hypothetical protein
MIEMLRIYSNGFWEYVAIEGPHDPLNLWKVIRHEKCQFSPTSLRAYPSNQEGKKKYFITIS